MLIYFPCTLGMLTGDEKRSNGNSYATMLNLDQDRLKFLANIGYCPQTDAIIGVLTGQEMVELYCRLRGVESVKKEADEWLNRVGTNFSLSIYQLITFKISRVCMQLLFSKIGLSNDANVQCSKYSGGMKRRLSAAMVEH